MDWSNERYVRLYTRDTPEWLMWRWQARAVLPLILRKLDRAGILELGKYGLKGLAATIQQPLEVVEPAMEDLAAEDGPFELSGDLLVMRNFIDAQEASQTDAQRKRESRARRRDLARRQSVTDCDTAGRGVTLSSDSGTGGHEIGRDGHETDRDRHARSQVVTPSLAVPSLADPALAAVAASRADARNGPTAAAASGPEAGKSDTPKPGADPGPTRWQVFERLWRRYTELAAEHGLTARPNVPGDEQRVYKLLGEGWSAEQVELGLAALAKRAASESTERGWWDGNATWSPEVLRKALSLQAAGGPPPRRPPRGTPDDDGTPPIAWSYE